MRPNNNYKRNRSRNKSPRNGNGSLNHKNHSLDSLGSEIRVRGNAVQVNEKYMALANDAYSSGDRILAESFFQYADHFHRVIMSTNNGIDSRRNNNIKEKANIEDDKVKNNIEEPQEKQLITKSSVENVVEEN